MEEQNGDGIGFAGKEGNEMDVDGFTRGRVVDRNHVLREGVDFGFMMFPFKENEIRISELRRELLPVKLCFPIHLRIPDPLVRYTVSSVFSRILVRIWREFGKLDQDFEFIDCGIGDVDFKRCRLQGSRRGQLIEMWHRR